MPWNSDIYSELVMRNKKIFDWFSGGPAGWNPITAFGSDLVLFINDANTSTMFKEISTSAQITPVTTNTDPIGLIYDVGPQGHLISINADTRRPTLSSDANRNSFLLFDGSNDFLAVANTKKYFSYFQGAAPTYSILLWAKSNGDGTLQALYSSNGRVTAQNGICLRKNADNTLNLFITNNSVALVNVNTTATFTTADGWTTIIVTCSGAGANALKIQIGNKTEQSFTMTAGTALDMQSDLHLGIRDGSVDNAFNGGLSAFMVVKRVITTDERTQYKAYNPSRTSTEFTAVTNFRHTFAAGKTWADTAKTTPITAGTAIRLAENEVTSAIGSLNRDITTTGASTSPLWRATDINSLPAAEFDGVDDNFNGGVRVSARAGKKVSIYIAKNRDAANGSHVANGSEYVTQVGVDYDPGNQRWVYHIGGGESVSSAVVNPTGYNLLVTRRNGTALDAWNSNKVKTSITTSQIENFTDYGKEFIAGWQWDGFGCYIEEINGYMTDAQIEAMIDTLKTTYGNLI